MNKKFLFCALIVFFCFAIVILARSHASAAGSPSGEKADFPPSLSSYNNADSDSIWNILVNRAKQEPFNVFATLIFFLAIVHTFLTGRFMAISHRMAHDHQEKINRGEANRDSVCPGAGFMHFLGEVEAVFGIWVIPLVLAIIFFYDWQTVVNYIGFKVNFTEAAFVVVIMTVSATRPILKLTENIIKKIASLLGGTLTALWFTTLTIGPVLGSFITEPAAMTISALVLASNFYKLEPTRKLKYGTLGLLFVNISVGGTLTHFAAPPVLMVAGPWNWTTLHMMTNFGWKAVLGILLANGVYFLVFKKEMRSLEEKASLIVLKDEIQKRYLKRRDMDAKFDQLAGKVSEAQGTMEGINAKVQKAAEEIRRRLAKNYIPELIKKGVDEGLVQQAFDQRFEEIRLREMRRLFPGLLPPEQRGEFNDPDWDRRDDPVPPWITAVHLFSMIWTIVNAHYPPLFVVGMLFFLGFAQVTQSYQNSVDLKPAMLVGFFLGGLVIHGGVQGWWIEPILGNLSENSADAWLHNSNCFQRQRRDYFSEHIGSFAYRQPQVCRGGRGGWRRRADNHCQRSQSGGCLDPQKIFR